MNWLENKTDKMIEIEKYDNVSDFVPSDLGLFIWMGNSVYFNGKLIYDKSPNAVYFYQGVFFLVEKNWKDSFYIDCNSGLKNNLKGLGGMICFIDKESILGNVWNDDYTVSTRQKINLETGSIIWESQVGHPYIKDEYFFGVLETKLCRVNGDTGEHLWKLDLPENYGVYSVNGEDVPVDVQKYIGLYNECLYIKAGSSLILGIDINSGDEKFNYKYTGENVVLDNLHLDHVKGVIFSIGSTDYFELNLHSYVAEIFTIKKEVEANDVKTTRLGSWENNTIYFWEGGTSDKFGAFDREEKKIKFVQTLDISTYPAIRDLNYGHGKLYVLDGYNKLHVFGEPSNPL